MTHWLFFAGLAGVIFFAGRGLVSAAEQIAAEKGWAQLWSGFILLSFATTLPELFTSAGAVAVVKSPDLALGNIFGSILFNFFLIAVLDLLQGPGPILKYVDRRLILYGGVFIAMASSAVIGLAAGFSFSPLGISPSGIIIVSVYFLGAGLARGGARRGKGANRPAGRPPVARPVFCLRACDSCIKPVNGESRPGSC